MVSTIGRACSSANHAQLLRKATGRTTIRWTRRASNNKKRQQKRRATVEDLGHIRVFYVHLCNPTCRRCRRCLRGRLRSGSGGGRRRRIIDAGLTRGRLRCRLGRWLEGGLRRGLKEKNNSQKNKQIRRVRRRCGQKWCQRAIHKAKNGTRREKAKPTIASRPRNRLD